MDEMHFVHHIKTKSRLEKNCNQNLETTQRTLPTFSIRPRSKKKRAALKYEFFLHGIKVSSFMSRSLFHSISQSVHFSSGRVGECATLLPPTFLQLLASNFYLGSMVSSGAETGSPPSSFHEICAISVEKVNHRGTRKSPKRQFDLKLPSSARQRLQAHPKPLKRLLDSD
jgi:hypothetical protein